MSEYKHKMNTKSPIFQSNLSDNKCLTDLYVNAELVPVSSIVSLHTQQEETQLNQ